MKIYDLEDRTFNFAKEVYAFSKAVKYSFQNHQILKQLIRSASSVGANYIEANESFSKKDFIYRIKICKKEAKESLYWLKLLDLSDELLSERRIDLFRECKELISIFGKIYHNSK